MVRRTDFLLPPELLIPHPVMENDSMHRTITVVLLATLTTASVSSCAKDNLQDRGSPPATANSPARADVWSEFALVSHDGLGLPQPLDSVGGCSRRLDGGTLRISMDHWERRDSLSVRCAGDAPNGGRTESQSGTLQHRGDTLVMEEPDSARRERLVIDRGIIHGDSLRTGGRLFDGPPRVYRRQ